MTTFLVELLLKTFDVIGNVAKTDLEYLIIFLIYNKTKRKMGSKVLKNICILIRIRHLNATTVMTSFD